MELQTGNSYLELLNEVYRSFNFFNSYFSLGTLKCPVIMISSSGSEQMMGWSGQSIWKRRGELMSEINICAEYLCRPPEEILETLLHEMTHLKCDHYGIKHINLETQYHYKSFAEVARSFGLEVEWHRRYGYCLTSLGDRAYEAIEKLNINRELFGMYRTPDVVKVAAKRERQQYMTFHVRDNEKLAAAVNKLVKKVGSKTKAVENAIIAAANHIDFDDVM